MPRVLLVTNDFPPRRGGIQSYLEELVNQLARVGSHALTVYAPKWKGAEDFDKQAAASGYTVVRHPGTLMLPEPSVATRMRRLIAEHDIDTVWFGAAAPLALMAPLARDAGGKPRDRQHPRSRGRLVDAAAGPNGVAPHRDRTDVVTYVSQVHQGQVRVGVRAERRARTPAARASTPTGSSPTRSRGPNCAPATGWVSGRWWCVCRASCRARARTC